MHCTLIFVRKTLANFTAHLQSSKIHRYNLIFPKLFYNNPATPEKERGIYGKVRNGRNTLSVAQDGRVVPLLGAGQGRLLWTSTILPKAQILPKPIQQSSMIFAPWLQHPKIPKANPWQEAAMLFPLLFPLQHTRTDKSRKVFHPPPSQW